ncbi:unnamed protein product [Danaus chrysippus]|uniref:(African queen) hypothetical protein n=1 Tax=Danaus chrysippus TaxID=151541 RepID=A0A8J2QZ89_9NEOP|nr:unnamed protein product [Danaus chrysippus]
MFGLFVLVALVGGGLCVDRHGSHPFVQARTDLTYVRLMLQDLVPRDTNNLTVPSARLHLSAGVLAGVTLAVGKSVEPIGAKYDPLSVLQEVAPAVWEDYNGVAADPLNNLLSVVNTKVLPVYSVIDVLCPGTDVETCNAAVESSLSSNSFLRKRGDILLSAGSLAHRLRKHEKSILAAVDQYLDLPDLIRAMQTQEYKNLVGELADLDRKLENKLL